ncbi:MAG: class I SAM-dependent methyltransferase [Mogibacterium sp.]|nr:class I SAM-dependent methyltransferase [Mogibacterium sp.]
MIRAAVFGAGQAGRMIRCWLPAGQDIICYIDNNEKIQGTEIDGIPVLSLAQALTLQPDRVWIATLNMEASSAIEQQLRDAGYTGTLRYAWAFRDAQDPRLASVRLIAREIEGRGIDGAVAELGVYRGELAAELSRLFPDRPLYLFDTFEGFPEEDLATEAGFTQGRKVWHPDFSDTSIELVRSKLADPDRAVFVPGRFPESLEQIDDPETLTYAFVSLDPDLYEPVLQGLEYFWPRMERGGMIVIHDYNSMQFPGVRAAVQEFCDRNRLMPVPLCDLHGTAVLVKG